ncbi:unnamed protein product [Bemisia tabaci]|uniref:Protein LTV1 homolog n=1 Tax=Bemisia tabaci TaxID=7038 RepID=A0A9P0F522_BEMTA|nr:unnamed protein product [Bemisia tabaci]
MPSKKKKKFGKDSVTFALVHRSQRDPLYVDETAPQHVLKPLEDPKKKHLTPEERKEEQRKYGVYFDDDYDYLKHLMPVGGPQGGYELEPVVQQNVEKDNEMLEAGSSEKPKIKPSSRPKIMLPSSMFASEFEEDVGLLNRNPPSSGLNLDLDPDIVAAMDEDFDYSDPENQLEDDFVLKANMPGLDDDDDYIGEEDEDYYDEERDDVGSMGAMSDDDFDTKSRFTNYSMSSSIIRRNEKLTILDDKFEKMFAEYDDGEIGALDTEEIEGQIPASSSMLDGAAQELKKHQHKADGLSKEEKEIILQRAETAEENTAEEEMDRLEIKPKEFWDCESILSTYSNIYNHPKLIQEPPKVNKIKFKKGIPVISEKLTQANLDMMNKRDDEKDDVRSVLSSVSRLSLSVRPKEETSSERKDRKNLVKQIRKERRVERKMNKLAFKEEKKKFEKVFTNNQINAQTLAL